MADEVTAKLAKLEEAVNSLKFGQSVIQWAGGFVLAVIALLAGSVFTRSFTISDQITTLTAESRGTNASVSAIQTSLGEVKADIREMRSDLSSVRQTSDRIAAKVGAQLDAQPMAPPSPKDAPKE